MAGLAAGVVSPPASCGITLERGSQPFTAASSGALAAHLDEVQYPQDDGPCLEPCAPGTPSWSRTWQALANRSVIDQVLGIVTDQQRCDAAQAFTVLREASQHRNRKLRDVAAELVSTVSGSTPAHPPFSDPS